MITEITVPLYIILFDSYVHNLSFQFFVFIQLKHTAGMFLWVKYIASHFDGENTK